MVNFVIALHCEAEPLIRRFALKPCGQLGRIAFFASPHIALAISGVGRVQAAIATTALAHRCDSPQRPRLWINLGICGHPSLPLGSPLFAHSIGSGRSATRFYPQPLVDPPWPGHPLVTCNRPEANYPASSAVDMEAHAFFAAAAHVASSEAIASIKVVSDNPSHPARGFPAKDRVARWIEPQLASIERWASETMEILDQAHSGSQSPPQLADICQSMRLSATERSRLAKLLRQLHHLGATLSTREISRLTKSRDSRSLLDSISRRVEAAAEAQIANRHV